MCLYAAPTVYVCIYILMSLLPKFSSTTHTSRSLAVSARSFLAVAISSLSDFFSLLQLCRHVHCCCLHTTAVANSHLALLPVVAAVFLCHCRSHIHYSFIIHSLPSYLFIARTSIHYHSRVHCISSPLAVRLAPALSCPPALAILPRRMLRFALVLRRTLRFALFTGSPSFRFPLCCLHSVHALSSHVAH